MLDILNKGGPVMFVLFALSIYVTAIIIYKAYQFWQCRLSDCDFAQEVVSSLKRADVDNATIVLNGQENPLARVIETALHCLKDNLMPKESKEHEIEIAGTAEIRKLESHLKGLEMSGNIAPLLGLLGTVGGMITTFATLQEAGSRIDPSLLAGGIWEALLTTVAGLSIAIPSVVAYYIIDGKIEKFRHALEATTTRIMNIELPATSTSQVDQNAF
jgi:biopolymer transport protein ExbB